MSAVLEVVGNAKSRDLEKRIVPVAAKSPIRFWGGWSRTIEVDEVTMEELDGLYAHPQFLADLKRVSAKVEPGEKLSREEGIKRVLREYADVIDALGD